MTEVFKLWMTSHASTIDHIINPDEPIPGIYRYFFVMGVLELYLLLQNHENNPEIKANVQKKLDAMVPELNEFVEEPEAFFKGWEADQT